MGLRRELDDPALRAVAAQEALDGLRGRRQLVIRALLPVLLFGVVLVTALVTRGADQRGETAFTVAVQGDLDGAAATLGLLGDDVVVEVTDDASFAAASGATIGVVVPDGLDERRAAGEPVTVEVYRSVADRSSRAAVALLVARVADADLAASSAAVRDAGGVASPGVAAFGVVDVQLTEAGTRELSGGLAPALLTLQAAMLVSGTATHLLARQRRGLLTAQLLLPLSRWRLALAKMLAEYAVGMLAAAPVLLAVLAFVGITVMARDGVADALVAVLACLATALVLSLLAASVGLAIGTRARSQEQVSLLTMIALVVFAVVAAVFALGTYPPVGPLALVPLAGLVSTLRDLLQGDGSLWWFGVALVVTTSSSLALAWHTSRHFDAERLVLRGAS